MTYANMAPEDLILLAAECVGRRLPIPQEIVRALSPDVLADIRSTEPSYDNSNDYADD